ncbi:hypothetical protein MTP99_008536 [Tenebrio molitor]|jgi:hypothetical protein|nr:hypothetical protein MTP99_008536 [Tenebrio molitor]CAH1367292.1 unnamed protein product [Tenebrio molitor]
MLLLVRTISNKVIRLDFFSLTGLTRNVVPGKHRPPKPIPKIKPSISIIPEKLKKKSLMSVLRRSENFNSDERFACPECGRFYKLRSSLRNHQKWECGKEPQFNCPHCPYKAKQKMHVRRHVERMHKVIDYADVQFHTLAPLDINLH